MAKTPDTTHAQPMTDNCEAKLHAALELLARTEDAEWNAEVKDFLRSHGYIERDAHSRYELDHPAFVKPEP